MEMKLDGGKNVRYCSLVFLGDGNGSPPPPPCTEQTISDQMSATYTYNIGDAKQTIAKPFVQIDTCATTCTITDNTPSHHSWWTDSTSFEIETNDASIVGPIP